MLLLFIFILTLFKEFSPILVKGINWIVSLYLSTSSDLITFKKELNELKNEQRGMLVMDEFSKYSKLQRKINALEIKITNLKKDDEIKEKKMKYGIEMMFDSVLNLILIFIVFYYGSTIVTTIDPTFFCSDYLQKLISFGSDRTPGGVSCLFWVFSCQVAFKTCVSALQQNFNFLKSENKLLDIVFSYLK